jgi:hypothetical protein
VDSWREGRGACNPTLLFEFRYQTKTNEQKNKNKTKTQKTKKRKKEGEKKDACLFILQSLWRGYLVRRNDTKAKRVMRDRVKAANNRVEERIFRIYLFYFYLLFFCFLFIYLLLFLVT